MNPILVNRWRGSAIEGRHRGFVAVFDGKGQSVLSIGDVDVPHYPRSAIKFIQAIPFVESGAIEHFALDNRHIALSCASHNGEFVHTNLVINWLEKVKLAESDLECGAELPLHPESQFELIRSGAVPRRYHHNCSGKHMGMLTTARYMGDSTKDYRLYKHNVQQRWFQVLEELAGVEVAKLPYGYDGCGIPTLGLTGRHLATAMARLTDPAGLSMERKYATQMILQAVSEEPYLVAGEDRLCTALMAETGKPVLAKTGADGCFCAVLTELGLGISIKIDDGNKQAAEVLLGGVLRHLGAINEEQYAKLTNYFAPQVMNSRGEAIGHVEVAGDAGFNTA